MEETNRRVLLLLLSFACFFSQLSASSDVVFYESFNETFEGRWIVSEKDDYKGVWKHSNSEGHEEDYGLLVSEKARKYAIVKELDKAVSVGDGIMVLQYEVRLQNGLECGGAYLKYLRPQHAGWIPKEFDNESPFSIMFGPDKCGATNKVHFIVKHKNPKSSEYVEHHLRFPPTIPYDKLTHVYTVVLKPNNELSILVDAVEKKKANFLFADDFDPPLIPSKTIPDPDDKKPNDWDDRPKIPDPDAKKPEDWDEDAPMEIVDEESQKPIGWLDDEPSEISDPQATKPEDWDDEEDGEWEAPKVENPKCLEAPGCGAWKRPMKRNPAYKGKWQPPFINNPRYKGVWRPREVPNPGYFELDKPNFDPIVAIGIEIWTMQEGLLFDNVLIATDEKVAESYRETTWRPKFDAEKEKEKAEEAAGESDVLKGFQKAVFDILYKIADLPFWGDHKGKVVDLLDKAEKHANLTINILIAIVVIIFSLIFRLAMGGGKQQQPAKQPSKETNKSDIIVATSTAEKTTEEKNDEDEKEEDDDAGGGPRRRARRDN